MSWVHPKTPNKAHTDLAKHFGFVTQAGGADVEVDLRAMTAGLRISKSEGAAQSASHSLQKVGGGTETQLITKNDILLAAIEFVGVSASGLASISFRNDCRVSSSTPGLVNFSGGATTTSQILVIWYDMSGWTDTT